MILCTPYVAIWLFEMIRWSPWLYLWFLHCQPHAICHNPWCKTWGVLIFSSVLQHPCLDSASLITSYTRERKLLKIRVWSSDNHSSNKTSSLTILLYRSACEKTILLKVFRGWKLVNSRYLLASVGFLNKSVVILHSSNLYWMSRNCVNLVIGLHRSCPDCTLFSFDCARSNPFLNVAHGPSLHTLLWNIAPKAIQVLKLVWSNL